MDRSDLFFEYSKPSKVKNEPPFNVDGTERRVFGIKVKTYYRQFEGTECSSKDTRCKELTSGGEYDLSELAKRPTEANLLHICMRCFEDNREDLGAPTSLIGLTRFATRPRKFCKNCKTSPDPDMLDDEALFRTRELNRTVGLTKVLCKSALEGSDKKQKKLARCVSERSSLPKLYWAVAGEDDE
jgi:hypothetical protein